MAEKVFWTSPYLTELEVIVQTVKDNEITVNRTIFYALSGGQESDAGTIGGYKVIQAKKDGHDILYTLEDGHTLRAGDNVKMVIDWERRYRLMRLHFAAEIVLVVVSDRLPGIEKIGAHISQDKARIDFFWPESLSPLFPQFEEKAHAIIRADYDIASEFSDVSNGRRYWEIKDLAKVPCGGTHLHRTGEVGVIKLKRNNIGRGKERIEIYLQD